MKLIAALFISIMALSNVALCDHPTGGPLYAVRRPALRTKLNYILINNPYMSKQVAIRAIRDAITDINKDGVVRVGIGKRRQDGDPFFDQRSYADRIGLYQFQTYFTAFSSWYVKNGTVKNEQFNILLDPPIEVQGINYMGGYAWLGGYWTKSFAYCNAMAVNDRGEARVRHLVQCIRHELYHLLCAQHDDTGPNIMHSNALAKYEDQRIQGSGAKLPLNEKARKEMLSCINTKASKYRRKIDLLKIVE